MKLCQRCSIQPAVNTVAGLPMCGVCTAQLDWRYGASKSQVAGYWDTIPGPIKWGKELGVWGSGSGSEDSSSDTGITGTVRSAADAAKSTASAVKTVAVVVGVVAGASLLYLIYKQAQNARASAHEALQVFGGNPNVQHAATHAILL